MELAVLDLPLKSLTLSFQVRNLFLRRRLVGQMLILELGNFILELLDHVLPAVHFGHELVDSLFSFEELFLGRSQQLAQLG